MKKPGSPQGATEHPNNSTTGLNGDVRQKRSKDRWNGALDMEDKGFTSEVTLPLTISLET